MTRLPVRLGSLVLVVVATTCLVACGGDAEPGSAPTGPVPTQSLTASPSQSTSQAQSQSPAPTAAPAELGFDAARLRALAVEARKDRSSCFLVAREGRVAGEWNWQGTAADTPREVFSVTKSVTSTLVGIAVADGDLALEDRASTYIPAWRGTPSASVTVRHLLANDSGRFWTATSDYSRLVRATDRTAYAVGLSQQHRPGRVWAYNNAAIQTLDAVLRSATGQDPAVFAQERLFGPLGMTHTRLTADGSGRSTNVFFGMQTTCADLARFGQLFAQDGLWEGEQVVPASWVRAAVGRPSQPLNAGYGFLWWLNRPGTLRAPLGGMREGQLAPGAPADLFAAEGLGGQVVLVDPTSQTVVVRLGEGSGDATYSFADAARVVTDALR